jgi:AsmA protein
MGRTLKWIGIVVGAIVVLFVAALVAVGMLVDPNDYKDEITAAVARATGRQLTLDGNLDLALFPSIKIAAGAASLSNAPGFGAAPMAKIGSAELSVGLFPLLAKRIEIGEVTLHGLELNLARDARGRNNWQDLAGAGADARNPPADRAADGKNLDLGIGAISITDARVTWNDASTGSRWELTNFGLDANGFGSGKKFPLKMRFGLRGADVVVAVDASTQATLSLATDDYRLENLAVTLDGSGKAWPGGQGKANLKFASLAANLDKETLELGGLTLEFLGVTMSGSLSGQKLLSNLSLSGAVDIHEFNPRNVLDALKVELTTADSAVLKSASAKANLLYTPTQLGLRDMRLKLDDSTLTGRIGMERERLTYSLSVDDINIDRYLPPAETGGSSDQGSLDAVDLPLDALRALTATGDLKFGKAKFSGLTLTDATFALTAANGALRLTPSASLYGGKYGGTIDVVVQDKAARLAAEQQLDQVDVGALGRDLLGSEDIKGTGNVKLKVAAAGTNLGQIRRDLDGDVSFSIANGSIEGIDLWYELRRARARLDKAQIPERASGPPHTSFSALTASGVVENAVLTNRDLTGKLDFMTLTGNGTVNLLTNAIDFDLKATFIDGPALQSDPAMVKYAGAAVPFRATGTVDEPSILPDFGAIVSQRVTNEVNQRVDEKKEELRNSVTDRLRDRLRGLKKDQ